MRAAGRRPRHPGRGRHQRISSIFAAAKRPHLKNFASMGGETVDPSEEIGSEITPLDSIGRHQTGLKRYHDGEKWPKIIKAVPESETPTFRQPSDNADIKTGLALGSEGGLERRPKPGEIDRRRVAAAVAGSPHRRPSVGTDRDRREQASGSRPSPQSREMPPCSGISRPAWPLNMGACRRDALRRAARQPAYRRPRGRRLRQDVRDARDDVGARTRCFVCCRGPRPAWWTPSSLAGRHGGEQRSAICVDARTAPHRRDLGQVRQILLARRRCGRHRRRHLVPQRLAHR